MNAFSINQTVCSIYKAECIFNIQFAHFCTWITIQNVQRAFIAIIDIRSRLDRLFKKKIVERAWLKISSKTSIFGREVSEFLADQISQRQ